ncbi:MAG: hypothetical protein ABF804_08815 [Liquorilactobacillus ghanensis]|uniref:hypothetical protein n=1 Tax=Liquorilactobacillus ghanensis TaxID=399370 RepID=UPI0039EBB193
MILYREAEMNELKQITEMCAQAYRNYPLFHILRTEFKSHDQYFAFLTELEHIYAKTFIRRRLCLVGTQAGRIVSVAMLQNPQTPSIGIIEYLRNGGAAIFKHANIFLVTSFLKLVDRTEAARTKITEPNWYLANLVVNQKLQGQHLGSDMLKKGVLPFIKQHKGKLLTFNTNTEQNSKFYRKNDFIEFDRRFLTWKNNQLENWSFMMHL